MFLAGVLLWQAGKVRRRTGLPPGRIVYDDSGLMGHELERPLFDGLLGLTGKPDYLVEQKGQQIPVEVKSFDAPAQPYESHIFQLAAYCHLVEHTTGKRPSHGILRYRNRTFAVDYTAELESNLLDTLAEMRRCERNGEADRSHEEPGRCARCGYRSKCDQRM